MRERLVKYIGRRGDAAAFAVLYGDRSPMYPNAAYRRQWWVLDPDKGIYQANGIFGQCIHIDVSRDLVIVKLSSMPSALHAEIRRDCLAAFTAIGNALN